MEKGGREARRGRERERGSEKRGAESRGEQRRGREGGREEADRGEEGETVTRDGTHRDLRDGTRGRVDDRVDHLFSAATEEWSTRLIISFSNVTKETAFRARRQRVGHLSQRRAHRGARPAPRPVLRAPPGQRVGPGAGGRGCDKPQSKVIRATALEVRPHLLQGLRCFAAFRCCLR